ncbi:MAG: PIN domain nuclease [Oligoflexia bacterium]|nr:PIN domain nuclease [Oligoflexia bacterium]
MELKIKKMKIYIDTSVISNLAADDAIEIMEYSHRLWDEIKKDTFEIIISNLVIEEIDECPEPKRTELIKLLDEIHYQEEAITNEAIDLAGKYIQAKIIPEKYEDDAIHIAVATILNCNAIISWNFKHMIKLKTIIGVNGINASLGYRTIEIVTPISVVSNEDKE